MNRKKKRDGKTLSYIILLLLMTTLVYLTFYNRGYIEGFIRDVFYYPVVKLLNDPKEVLDYTINDEIKRENEELRKLLDIDESLNDFEVVNATVISRNTSSFLSFFTINKGSIDGLVKGMAVVTGGGLIGVVDSVSLYTSVVKMITNMESKNKVSVNIVTDEKKVNAIMEINDDKKMLIQGLDKNSSIKKGERVITSGLSDIFPNGIIIGYIDSITMDTYMSSYNAYVTLYSDLDNFRYVAVLKRGKS